MNRSDLPPNNGGLSEAEQALLAAFRASDLIGVAKVVASAGLVPDGIEKHMPLTDATIKRAHQLDLCDAAEALAFAVLARLVATMAISRSTVFSDGNNDLVRDIAEALTEAAQLIGLPDLRKD